MSFARKLVNIWSRIKNAPKPTTVRIRPRRANSKSVIPAQIEHLESRRLLTVSYQGGTLLAHVEVQPLYLGSDWATDTTLQSQKTQLDQFAAYVVNSPFMDMLANSGYNVGRGTATAGGVDNVTLSKTTAITDAQIQSQIQSMITSGKLQAPDANRLYITYVEPGVAVQYGGSSSTTSFLGYHSAFAGKTASGAAIDIHYAVIPHPGSPNFTSAAAGFSTVLNEMTEVSSHELAESVTSPNTNYKLAGWIDPQSNEEVSDLANGQSVMLNGYQVADVVNRNGTVVTPSTQQTTPPSGLVAPTFTGSALSSTSVRLSWNSVASVEGYRVFKVSGSQLQLLGTVAPGTLTYTISGLAAGSTTSFKVESYRGTAFVDSSAVAVTTPAAVKLASPQLAVSALSKSIAWLTWNSIAGATGYRIYSVMGTGAQQLLGTVSSSAALGGKFYISITNLLPGSTRKFMVEAYNSTQTGDSPWLSLTMPLV
jgi:hypothetical protein